MRWILAAFLLVASAAPALAQLSPYTCELYFADSENGPPEVGQILKSDSRGALRICSNWLEPDSSYIKYVSAPLRGNLGVCQIVESRLYKHESGWLSSPPSGGKYYGPPSVSMMLAEGECPRQDDKRYTITNHVSEGVFAAAVKFWKDLSSGVGQEALFAAVDPLLRSNSTFQEFESAVRSAKAFKLVSVNLDSAPAYDMNHYSFWLDGNPKNFSLEFDFDENGLVVLGIREYVY